MEQKTSAFRQVINKIFCLHKLKVIDTVYHYDNKGNTISKSMLLVCDICGKVKTKQI